MSKTVRNILSVGVVALAITLFWFGWQNLRGTTTQQFEASPSPTVTPSLSLTPSPEPTDPLTGILIPQPPVQNTVPTSKPQATNQQTVANCTANDLEGSVAMERASGYVVGYLVVQNRSNRDCSVSGYPGLNLSTGNKLFQTKNTLSPLVSVKTIVLKPKQTTFVRFFWSNWCGEPNTSSIFATLGLGGARGYLRVPILQDGNVYTLTPQCDTPTAASTLSITAFGIPE